MSLQHVRTVKQRSINRKMHSECMKQRQSLISSNNTSSTPSPILSRTTFSQANQIELTRELLQEKVNNRIVVSDKEIIDLKFITEGVAEIPFENNGINVKDVRCKYWQKQSTILPNLS